MSRKISSDWAIAAVVVLCSLVLFFALFFSISGNPFRRPDRMLRVYLPDATGIAPASLIKFGGAIAGTVHGVEMLSPEQRIASGDPSNTVEVVLALAPNVPILNEGLSASISSDTLLSDKFILLTGGDPGAPPLANNAVIPGTPPTTFDALARRFDETLDVVLQLAGSAKGDADGLMPRLNDLLTEVESLLKSTQTVIAQADTLTSDGIAVIRKGDTLISKADTLVTNADGLVDDASTLVADIGPPARTMIAQLNSAADSLDDLAIRVDRWFKSNEAPLDSTIKNMSAASAELRATSIHARALAESLLRRPQQLIWGPGRSPNTVIEVPDQP